MRAKKRYCRILVFLCLAAATGLVAQESQPAEPYDQTEPTTEVALVEEQVAAPAPFDVEAATEAYLSRLSPEEKARSDASFEGGYWLQLWGFLYSLGVAWLLLGTGLSAKMRDLAERITR